MKQQEIQFFKVLNDLFADLKPLKNGEGSLNALEYALPTNEYLEQSNILTYLDLSPNTLQDQIMKMT